MKKQYLLYVLILMLAGILWIKVPEEETVDDSVGTVTVTYKCSEVLKDQANYPSDIVNDCLNLSNTK